MAPEIKKMKQGMSYSRKEKTIILNVFKYFQIEYPDKCVTEIVRRTSRATGCSEKSVFQFRKEEASAEGFREPSKTKVRKNLNINSRDIKYDNSIRQGIRNIIYSLKYRNIVPSLNTILKQINSDQQLPNFSLMTLRRLLFDMGFYYEKNGNKSILVEKSGVINKDNVPEPEKAAEVKPAIKPPAPEPPGNSDLLYNNNNKKIEPNQTQNVNSFPNQYNNQNNNIFVPMPLAPNENHGHVFGPYNYHHMINSRLPSSHVVQPSWIHQQMQTPLAISSN